MDDQGSFFAEPQRHGEVVSRRVEIESPPQHARREDPETSHDWARTLNVGTIDHQIVMHLVEHGPKSSLELHKELGVPRENIAPRLRPLERLGILREDGKHGRGIAWAVK